jgi:hypothetical protein
MIYLFTNLKINVIIVISSLCITIYYIFAITFVTLSTYKG